MVCGLGWRRRTRANRVLRLPIVVGLVALHLVTTAFVHGGEAHACSCTLFTLESALADGDAAFVGTAVDQRLERGEPTAAGPPLPLAVTFDVVDVVKGELPSQVEVWTGEGDGDCGIGVEIGETVGIVLRRAGDRWTASLCGGVWLAEELSNPGALAPPTGSGEVALIAAGRTGPALLASFDIFGDLTAWGLGESVDELLHLRLCPGSTTFVGITVRWTDQPPVAQLVRRDVATLSTIGSVTLPERAPHLWPEITDARDVECTSPEGDVALLLSASGFRAPANSVDNVVIRVAGDAAIALPVEHGWALAAAPDGSTAFVISGEYGTVVERMTLADGTVEPFADLAGLGGRELAVHDATGRVAVIATTKPEFHPDETDLAHDRLVVLDAAGSVMSTAELPDGRFASSVDWFDNDHVVAVWEFPTGLVEVIGLDGEIESSVEVISESVAVLGDQIYLASPDGVETMTIDGDDRRLLAPTIARVHAVLAVPCGPVAIPQATQTALRSTAGRAADYDLPAAC